MCKKRLEMSLPWRKEMTLNASTWWSSRESRCADSIHRQSIGRSQLYVKNGNFYCHERPVCYWSPRRQNWAGSMEWTAAVMPKEKLALKSLDLVEWNTCQMAMKKVKQPGVRTREPIDKQPGVGTQEPMEQEHSQQQARVHEATQCDKTAETKQREEWV